MMEMEADAASTASKEEEDGHFPGEESSKGDMDSSQERKNEEEAKKANISDEKDDNAQLKEESKDPKSVNKDTANAKKCPENDQKEDADCSNSKVPKESVKPSSSSDPGTPKDEASRDQQSAEPAETAKSTSASTTTAVPSSTATLDKCSSVPTKIPKLRDKAPDSGADVLSPVAPDVVSSQSQTGPAETTIKQSVSLPSSKGNASSPLVTTTSSVKPATCSSPTDSSVVSSDDSVVKKNEKLQPSVSSQNEIMPCSEDGGMAGSSSEASDKQSVVIDSSADPPPHNNSASQSVTSSQVTPLKPLAPKSSSVSSSIVSSSTSEKNASPSVNSSCQSTKSPSPAVSSSSLSVSKMQSSSISSSSLPSSSALPSSPPEVTSSKPFPEKSPRPQKSVPKPSVNSPEPSPIISPSKCQSSPRPSGVSSSPVKLTRPQFSSSSKSSPAPSFSGKPSAPSGGRGVNPNLPATQSASSQRSFHSSPKPSSTPNPSTSSSAPSSTSSSKMSPPSSTPSQKNPSTPSTSSHSSPTASSKSAANPPVSSPKPPQPSRKPSSANPSSSTSNSSRTQPELVPSASSTPQNTQEESSQSENASLPSTDFSVPDIRRDCPTEPSSPPASVVPDVLRTGSEEENRQLGRMLNNVTPFGGGIPPPLMPDLCQRGDTLVVATPFVAPRSSSEANVDLLCPAGPPENLSNMEEGQVDSSNIPSEIVEVESGTVNETEEKVPEREEVKKMEACQKGEQKGISSCSSSEVGTSSSSSVAKDTNSAPIESSKDAESEVEKMIVESESDVSSSSKEAGVLDAESEKRNNVSKAEEPKDPEVLQCKDSDENVSAMGSGLKEAEEKMEIASEASGSTAVAAIPPKDEVSQEEEKLKPGDDSQPKTKEPLEELKESTTGAIPAECPGEKMTVERGEVGKDSASAEEERNSSLMVPPPIAHLPADAMMKDSGKELPEKEGKEPRRDEAGPAIPLLKSTPAGKKDDNPKDITPRSKELESVNTSVAPKEEDAPKSDIIKENDGRDENGKKGEGESALEKNDSDTLTDKKGDGEQSSYRAITDEEVGSFSPDVKSECLESERKLLNCNIDSDEKSDLDPKCSLNTSVEETVKETFMMLDMVCEEKTETAAIKISESSNPVVSELCKAENSDVKLMKKSEIDDTAITKVIAEKDLAVSEDKKIKDKHKQDEDAIVTAGIVIADNDSAQKQSIASKQSSEKSISVSKATEVVKETNLNGSQVQSDENVMSAPKENAVVEIADSKKHCAAAVSSLSEVSENISVANLPDSKCASSQVQIRKDSSEKEAQSSKPKLLDNNHVETVQSELEKSQKVEILPSSVPVKSKKDKIDLPIPVKSKEVISVGSVEEEEITDTTTTKKQSVTSSSHTPKLEKISSEPDISLKSEVKEEKEEQKERLPEKPKDNNSASCNMHSINVSSVCKNVPAKMKASSLGGDKNLSDDKPRLPLTSSNETGINLSSTVNRVSESQDEKSLSGDIDARKVSTQVSCIDVDVTEDKNTTSIESDAEITKSVPTAPAVIHNVKSATVCSSSKTSRSQDKEESFSKSSSHLVSKTESSVSSKSLSTNKKLDIGEKDSKQSEKTMKEDKSKGTELIPSVSLTPSGDSSEKQVTGHDKMCTSVESSLNCSLTDTDCIEHKEKMTDSTRKEVVNDLSSIKEVIQTPLMIKNQGEEEIITSKDIPVNPKMKVSAPELAPVIKNEDISLPKGESTHSEIMSQLEACLSPGDGKEERMKDNSSQKGNSDLSEEQKICKSPKEVQEDLIEETKPVLKEESLTITAEDELCPGNNKISGENLMEPQVFSDLSSTDNTLFNKPSNDKKENFEGDDLISSAGTVSREEVKKDKISSSNKALCKIDDKETEKNLVISEKKMMEKDSPGIKEEYENLNTSNPKKKLNLKNSNEDKENSLGSKTETRCNLPIAGEKVEEQLNPTKSDSDESCNEKPDALKSALNINEEVNEKESLSNKGKSDESSDNPKVENVVVSVNVISSELQDEESKETAVTAMKNEKDNSYKESVSSEKTEGKSMCSKSIDETNSKKKEILIESEINNQVDLDTLTVSQCSELPISSTINLAASNPEDEKTDKASSGEKVADSVPLVASIGAVKPKQDVPSVALSLNDSDSSDGSKFKKRADVKQSREKSILGITEKLAVANQMRQQQQNTADTQSKESVSPRKMPGLIEMGVAKASRRKNLAIKEDMKAKKAKLVCAPENNESSDNKVIHDATLKNVSDASIGKCEVIPKVPKLSPGEEKHQQIGTMIETPLYKNPSKDLEMQLAVSSGSIIDLSSKKEQNPVINASNKVNTESNPTTLLQKDTVLISTPKDSLEIKSIDEDNASPTKYVQSFYAEGKKEDGGFKSPRMKRISGKDKTPIESPVQPVGPATRTRTAVKPSTSPKTVVKADGCKEKNSQNSKNVKVPLKKDDKMMDLDQKRKSVEVSTEPFTKETETKILDPTAKDEILSIRSSPSQSPIRSSKLLEVIRVAGEKDIVKVNDVEVMREPVGVSSSNCPLSLLRKTASNISGYSLSVSAHDQRKESSVEAKNIPESLQVDAASAGSKFPPGNTESWEFVAKVGEVELLRESPRAVPKVTPPPLTITVESPGKKTKDKPDTRKPGRPPSMPPPTKMPEFVLPPTNLMEQTVLAHQNLRNQSLEVLVGIGNRPEGLDLRGQVPPLGMHMGSAPIWQMPTDERGRSAIPRSAGVDFTMGRPSSAGEISSEGDSDKRRKGTKSRVGPPPKWQSQEADLLSVKLDGHPLGTWSPRDWRSIPPTSMGLWPPGYNYGFPIRHKGPMEPRGSRSVSPPQVGQDNRGMEQMPEDLSNPPVPTRGRSRDSPHSFRPPFAYPATSFPGGSPNFSTAGVMSYPSPSHMSKNSNVFNLAKSTLSASSASDTAMNLTMCKQVSATPPPLPVMSSTGQQSSRQSSVPVNLVKTRSSSPKSQAQAQPNSDSRGAVLPGGIIVPNLPLIFGRDYSHPVNTPSGRVSHCSAEENRETETNLSQVRCSSEPPRDHVPERTREGASAFLPTNFMQRPSSANVTSSYQPPRPASSTSIVEVSSHQSTSSESNLLPGGVVIPNFSNSAKPGEEQWNYENAKSELPVRSASALAQFHTEEPASKSTTPKAQTPAPAPPPVLTISTPTPPQKTGPGRRGGRSETPPPDKYNFRVEEAHVVRSSDIGGGGPGGNKLYACDICSGVYRRAFSLKRHYLRAHINYCHLSERDLSNCGIVVGDKMAVQTGGSGRRPYVHTTLPKNSEATADDNDEKANNNVGGRRTLLRDLFRCHTCGVCFDEKKRLKAHLMEHQCGSNRPSLLRQHAATHTPPAVIPKATPPPKQHPSSPTPVVFLCAYCDKRFSSAAVRRRHRKLHESSPGPHPCYLCETSEEAREHPGETSSFAQLEDLRAHMASTHKEVYHSCDLCGERLPSILALEEHAESHRSHRKAADGSDEEDEEEEVELGRGTNTTSAEGSTTSESAPAASTAQGEEEEFRYTCGVCQKMFTNYVNMCRHRRLAHGASQAKVTGRKGGAAAGVKQGGGDSGSSSRSQSPVVVSQTGTGERGQHRDLLDGEPSSSSSSSVPSPCPYQPPYAANDPETLFYTRLAGNIRDNLLNYLDGKLNRDNSNKRSKDDEYEVTAENGDDSNKIEPYLSWEKYNFPKDFQQMSFWDISTQLVVRNNMIRASNTPPVEQPAVPAFPQTLALVETSKAAEITKDLKTEEATEETDVEGEWPGLSGEWIRPRSYICCACASRFNDLWSLEDHQYSKHPNVWCTHLEVEDGAVVLPGTPKLSPGSTSLAVSFLGDLLCRKPLGPRGALLAAPAIPPTLNNGMDSPSAKCTKCSRLCPSLPDLHSHMLECGGDLAWAAWAGGSSPAASSRRNSKKWRPFGSRRRRQRGRRGMKRNIPSSPVKMHRARHRGTDSDTIQRMIANLPAKRATRRVIQFNEDEIKTRSQATIHSVSFTGTFVRVSGYKSSQGVKPGAPTAAKRGRPPKNPVPPSTPVSSEGTSTYNASPGSIVSPSTASPAGTTSPSVIVKKGRGRPPGSKSKPSVPSTDLSTKRRIGEALPDISSPEADRYSLVKRSRMGTSPINQHQTSTTTPNAPGEPYICKGCGTVFDNASSCERHGKKCVFRRQMPSSPTADGMRNSSSGSVRPVHSCPHCGKNFTYATPMEKHVRACQGGASPKGHPVQVRRATASDTMEDSALEESEKGDEVEEPKKDWEVEGVEESVPAEEVIQAPPQEPDMPQLQKEEPVASPLPKDEDIPILTPVAPDKGDEKKESSEESAVEAEMQVDKSAVQESEESDKKEDVEFMPTDREALEAVLDVETVDEIEVKEEVPSAEEAPPVSEIMPQDTQEIIKSLEEKSIPVETTAEETKENESDKKDEEAVEEKQVQNLGKRTRGSSLSRQGSKKNKTEDDIAEEVEEVEPQKKKPGRKSTGGLAKQKTPKAVKASQAAKAESENPKVEVKEEESKASVQQDVEENKSEVTEVPEASMQRDTKDSKTAEKDVPNAPEEEEKTETKSKRGRKPKNQKSTSSQESVAKNADEKQNISVTPSVEKASSEKKKESQKLTETIIASEEKAKDETLDVKSKSNEDDTEEKSSKLAKEKMKVKEYSSPSLSVESVDEKISEVEKEVDEDNAQTKEVDDSKDIEEQVDEDKKEEEEDDDEEDRKDSEAKKNSKLRGTKGSKGKVTKSKKKKKKWQELKKEVENFWCDVCQMGYSSAFNLVKHGMSQKHKWNLRLGKEKLEKEAEEKLKKEGEEKQESEEGKSPSKEQDSENEKQTKEIDEMGKEGDDKECQVEVEKKSSTEEEEETNKDAPEENSVELSINETSTAVSSKSGQGKSPKSKDKESGDAAKNKGAVPKTEKDDSHSEESGKKEDFSVQCEIKEESVTDGGTPSKSSDSATSEEASKGSQTKNQDGVTGQDQLVNTEKQAGKEVNVKSSAKEKQSNITKVSPEAVVAAAPESATVNEGTKSTNEGTQRNSWTEAPTVQPASQEFVQPAVAPPTNCNPLLEWDNNMVPPAPMQAQTGGPQHHHQTQQDGWGAYGGWEAPSTDPNPPPSPGLWRYQPPNPMPWGEPQHSLSPIPRVPTYTEDPAPVTHPSPPNPSLGSILDSVNRILGEDGSGFDSTRMHAATAPEDEYGGVGLFAEGSLAELQRAMGATDEEMAMLQQLGTGPLDFVYDNNAGLASVADGGPDAQDQTGPLPNAELVDLDNQPASVTMVEGPIEEAEATTLPAVSVNTSDAITADGLSSKRKRCGPLPSKCKRFPPPNREGRVWRGGRRPALAQTSLASAHLLISQYEKKEMVCPVCNRHFLGLAALETHVSWVHKLKDAKQHILEGESTGYLPGKKATQTTSNSLRELVVGRAGAGTGGVAAASSPTPSRRLPCFVCKELYSDVISLNHHIAQQHLRRRPGEGGAVPEIDGDLKSQMTSALGDLLGKALANFRNRTDPNNPNAKPGLHTSASKSPSFIFPKLNLLGKAQEKLSPSVENPRKSFGGPSSCDGPVDFLSKIEPSSESPEVTLFRRDDGVDPSEWSSDGEDSAKGHEIDMPEESAAPSFHHVCPFCGDRFQKLSSRNRHISVAHRDPSCLDMMRLPRNASHDSTDFDDLLNRNKDGDGALLKEESSEELLETGRRNNHHPCPGCQLSFLRHSQLEAHLKRAHNGSDSQLPDTSDSMMECPICRESMNHFLKLCKHVKAKHREWSINCFTTEMHHHLILRKESPEESMVIRKKFLVKMKAFPVLRMASPTPSSKSSEEESHMDPDPKGNYLCSVCGVNFKSPQGVIRHLNLEHNSNHLEGALPMQKIFQRNATKEYRGRTGGGTGSDIKAKAEAALRELNLSQKFKLSSMSGSKSVVPTKGSTSRKSEELQSSGGQSRGAGRGRGASRRGRGRRGGRSAASSDVEKSLFDVYEFEDDEDDNEEVSSRVGSADGGSSRVDSECGGDDEEEEEEAIGDEESKGTTTPAAIKGKRASVDSSSSDVKYTCHSCGKGYKSLSAFWKHTKGVRGLCASGSSSPRSADRGQDTTPRGNKASGSKKSSKEDDETSDAESEVGGRVLRRLRGSGDNFSESLDGGNSSEVEVGKKKDKAPKKGKRKAEEEKKGAFSGGETVRTYGGKRVKQQQAEERKGRSSEEGSAGRRSTGASEAAFDALRGGGTS